MNYTIKIQPTNQFKVGVNTNQVFGLKYPQANAFKVGLST